MAKRLNPSHRLPLVLPKAWPACVQDLLRDGASWLHGDGWGGDLLTLPGGPLLESRWEGGRWITMLNGQEVQGRPFDILERTAATSQPWIGALSYELACSEAGLPYRDLDEGSLGQAWRGVTQALHVEDGAAEIWSWGEQSADRIRECLGNACALARPQLGAVTPRWSESAHRDAVEAIRARILDGGFYVANLCVPFDGTWSGDVATLAFSSFRRADPPFGALLPLDGLTLLCLSMERVLGKTGTRLVSEPIKGSAPRTGHALEDERSGRALRLDPKEQAEHTMIVDLVRNDLGRVAERGSVAVSELMALKAYPTVQHLVSRVEATARPDAGLAGVLRSMLPGGSVTGAPKHAVCTHIASAEAAPRGFYCGALGWMSPSGDFDWSLPIRTAIARDNRLDLSVGGGIVADSDPAAEWEETVAKARCFFRSEG